MSAVYLPYISERQRRPAEKWPRPFGLRPKYGQPALLVVHLESLDFSPRAWPVRIRGGNADAFIVLTGPEYSENAEGDTSTSLVTVTFEFGPVL